MQTTLRTAPTFFHKIVLSTALGAMIAFMATATPAYAEPAPKDEDRQNTYKMLNLFGDVYDRVRKDYVEEVSDEDLVKAAINGMLTDLDPHSSYLSEKDFKEMQVQTKGEFGGLGIEVTMDSGLVKVVSPIDDTPAFKAGVKAGDFISHIDDEPVMGLTLPEAVEKMRGKVGSKIKITVLREGEKEPLNFEIMRDKITIESVSVRAEGDIAYIRIRSFSEAAHPSLVKEYKRLEKEMGTVRGVVLDLRNNPGGLLDQAVEISNDFLNQGEIVSTRGREATNTQRYNAREGTLVPMNVPVVVLVNNGSASASEIVAGALQDHKRAIVLGTETFGKGSVQTVIPLPGYGAMRLTTARYYTPSGRSIQAEGIVPDIYVEPAKVEPIKQTGLRLEGDLRGHLDKGSTATNNGNKDKTNPLNRSLEENPIEDYQLSRALDLLRGLAFVKAEK